MTQRYHVLGLAYLALLTSSSLVLPALALPSAPPAGSNRQARVSPVYQHYPEPQQQYEDVRKYAEKPNASKKVVNDAELDLQNNSVQEGFSWSTMLGNIMQMLFTPALNKSDNIDTDSGIAPSPWANILAVGLKILTAILGGGVSGGGDGIDKVDNSSPLQFINIVVNLLDALKTSFSQRSLQARSVGRNPVVTDAAVAGITLLKGYVRTLQTSDDICIQKIFCDANSECARDVKGIYCQLGNYATSYMAGTSGVSKLYDAGRRGRSGEDCQAVYQACNEV
ncbi:hypothetical protein B566_EDAN005940 [Ephemera danica]|nr:hypothetical protein B566_EDAN005940 [Ephemera danica]